MREKRGMDDDGIDLSTEVTYVRPRRQALMQTSMISHSSSVKKDSCGIDLDVYQLLERKKADVKKTRTERKRIEQLLLNKKVANENKEKSDLSLQQQESETTKKIEMVMQEINKITIDGDAQLQSEKDETNKKVSDLQTDINNLKTIKTTEDLSELRAQVVRTTSDVNEQQRMNDEMKRETDFAESRRKIAVERSNACSKLPKDLGEMQAKFDGDQVTQIKRNDIRQNNEWIGSRRDCCQQKQCDMNALGLRENERE